MKEKIIQFGEGNFLRAFVEWIVERMNRETDFNGSVVVLSPRGSTATIDSLRGQNCRYHVHQRGLDADGGRVDSVEEVTSVSRCVNPVSEYADYMSLAHVESLRFVVSNTTEAGIAFDSSCKLDDTPPTSYPAKLTQWLYERFRHFGGDASKGMIILPCELIFGNGKCLRQCVMQYVELWGLPDSFRRWVEESCHFCTTLVDRIVTGRDTSIEGDAMAVACEPYHLWVIEHPEGISPESLEKEFPVTRCGLNVVITDDETPYHERKVTLLNGTHTVMAAVGLQRGIESVREAMENAEMRQFIEKLMQEELMPSLLEDGRFQKEELDSYIAQLRQRFLNPFIDHKLESIMLNAMSKFETRDMPALLSYWNRTGHLPQCIVEGLAAIVDYQKKR